MSAGTHISTFSYISPLLVARFAGSNDFLVNITNDAWFYGEPEASQHLSIMTFRAIENRISIVRSANTGISGWVSFKGQIEIMKQKGKQVLFSGVKRFSVSRRFKRSFYNKYGEIFSILCSLFLLGVCLKSAVSKTSYNEKEPEDV